MRYSCCVLIGILFAIPLLAETANPTTHPASRKPHPATRPDEVLDLTLDQLGNFEVDEEKPVIPPDVAALDGVAVRLHGYMIPIDNQDKSCRFTLIRKYWEGGVVTESNPVPKFQETVLVTCGKDKAVDVEKVWKKPIVIEGRLSVCPIKEDGIVIAIFAVQMGRCDLEAPASTRPAAAARTPHPAPRPGETLDLTVEQLGNFDVDQNKPVIPADVIALSGCIIRLRGKIIPLDSQEKTSRFDLVPSRCVARISPPGGCAAVPQPGLQQVVLVSCPKERAVATINDEVIVEGKLSVGPVKEDGFVTSLFTVEMDSCRPVASEGPATKPSDAPFELRAASAFAAGDYTKALPMLKTVAGEFKDQPDRLAMVQEQIRVCEKSLSAPSTQPAVSIAPTTFPAADVRTPHPAPKPGEILDLSIKELGNFQLDEDNPVIPADVKALNGTTVRLRGYMIPLDQAESVSRFALVPSLFQCCLGPRNEIQHTIVVNCPKGKAVSYCSDEIVIEGKLTVDLTKDDGYLVGVFAVETTSVKPAKQ